MGRGGPGEQGGIKSGTRTKRREGRVPSGLKRWGASTEGTDQGGESARAQ